jgi:chromosome segregation ATPase
MEEETFIANVNATPKTFGHNKFQLDIERLQDEVAKLNLTNNEKEMKLNLFKKNVANLQSELTSKIERIALLENQQGIDASLSTAKEHGLDAVKSRLDAALCKLEESNLELKHTKDELEHTKKKLDKALLEVDSKALDQSQATSQFKSRIDAILKEKETLQNNLDNVRSQQKLDQALLQKTTQEHQLLKENYAKDVSELRSQLQDKETLVAKTMSQLEETEERLVIKTQSRSMTSQPIVEAAIGQPRGRRRAR